MTLAPCDWLSCLVRAEVVLILNKFGNFCPEVDEDVDAGQQAQVRNLVKRMLEQRIDQAQEDESSDLDDI